MSSVLVGRSRTEDTRKDDKKKLDPPDWVIVSVTVNIDYRDMADTFKTLAFVGRCCYLASPSRTVYILPH